MGNDILAELIDYLDSVMAVDVSSEVPATRPARFVTVNPVGGAMDKFTANLLYTVQAYGLSDLDASGLLESALSVLFDAPDHIDAVCRVEATSTYRSDYEDSHRWAATVQVLANRY